MGIETNFDKLKTGLEEYVEADEFKRLVGEVIKSGNLIGDVVNLARFVIYKAEEISDDLGLVKAGGDKKKAVVQVLDGCFKFHPIIEIVDGKIIGIIVEAIVSLYNAQFGQKWIDEAAYFLGLKDRPVVTNERNDYNSPNKLN